MRDFELNLNKPKLPAIEDVKPYANYVYVELLSAKETLRTTLEISGNPEVTVNEAYILALGSLVPDNYGLKVGHRVFIDGGIVFGPAYKDYVWQTNGRKRGMVLYTAIKGQIIEESAIVS